VFSIYGDGVRDNTAEFQVQIDAIAAQISLGLGASAVLQLVGHTRVDWSKIAIPRFSGFPPRIEIDGTHEVLGGTLAVEGFELEGKAGAQPTVPGALSKIVGPVFDPSFTFAAASITEKTKCGLFFGVLPPDQFNPDLTPSPSAVEFLNASIGLTMSVSGATKTVNNNSSWVMIGWRFIPAPYPLNLEVRAILAGAVAPDTVSVSLNGRSNNGVQSKAVIDVFHVTGLAPAKLTNDFLSSYVGFRSAANLVFNLGDDASMARIFGVAGASVAGKFSECYAVNANATDVAILPDANNGTITAVVSSPLVRVAAQTEIRNLLIQHWGIPLMIDNANGVKLRRVDCEPQFGAVLSTPMSVPCVVDTCFEVWFVDCGFPLNSDLSATQFAPAAVWLTVSQVAGFTGADQLPPVHLQRERLLL
jgi:hypothetical protein